MKKILTLAIVLTGLLFVSISGHAFAVDVLNPSDGNGPCNNANATSTPVVCGDNDSGSTGTNPIVGPNGILTVVVKLLSIAVGVVAVVIIIIQAMRMVISNGSTETVAKARSGIIFAVVGLVIAVAAQAIVLFVLDRVQ
jgi:hypothetical protein